MKLLYQHTTKALQQLTRITSRAHSMVTSGLSSICNKIKTVGPLTVTDYVRECLLNPVWGYYATRDDIIGSKGDFITSPEISQVFGELLGVWVLADFLVQKGNSSSKCSIVELGPGRGTLARDIIRVFNQLKDHCGSLELHLIEASSKMAALQYNTLTGTNITTTDDNTSLPSSVILDSGISVTWYRHLADVPRESSYYIAHEFFDALPVHQFKLTDKGWREILVDIESHSEQVLRFIQSPSPTPASVSYSKLLNGYTTVAEVSPDTILILEEIADRVANSNGAALIADYGESSHNNKLSLRGFSDHKESNVLNNPGLTDITADVDFSLIKTVAEKKGVTCHGPITQNEFLHKMGIRERVNALINSNKDNDEIVDNLLKSYEMLTSPKRMGERFKFMSITGSHRHAPTPL